MLILTRRIGEVLMIGDQITVTVMGVKGGQVRLGVNAPKSVGVDREEIYLRKHPSFDGCTINHQHSPDCKQPAKPIGGIGSSL